MPTHTGAEHTHVPCRLLSQMWEQRCILDIALASLQTQTQGFNSSAGSEQLTPFSDAPTLTETSSVPVTLGAAGAVQAYFLHAT